MMPTAISTDYSQRANEMITMNKQQINHRANIEFWACVALGALLAVAFFA